MGGTLSSSMRSWVLRVAPQTTKSQLSPTGRSVPGIMASVVGRRPHTGIHLTRFINHQSHASGARTFCRTSKHCNFNDTISMFEMFTRELHATFLRTTTRGRKTPRRHPHPRQPPQLPEARGALHPIRGATPDQGHYTRTEEVHCLRIGCSAPTHKNKRGTGKPSDFPPTSNPSTGHRARNDNPVSAGSGPSPKPRWLQYRSASPVR